MIEVIIVILSITWIATKSWTDEHILSESIVKWRERRIHKVRHWWRWRKIRSHSAITQVIRRVYLLHLIIAHWCRNWTNSLAAVLHNLREDRIFHQLLFIPTLNFDMFLILMIFWLFLSLGLRNYHLCLSHFLFFIKILFLILHLFTFITHFDLFLIRNMNFLLCKNYFLLTEKT